MNRGNDTERERAERALRRQNEYSATLHETALALMHRLELADLLKAVVTRAGALMGTPHGYVYLLEPGEAKLQMRVGMGIYDEYAGYRLSAGEGLAGRVLESGRSLVVEDYAAWEGRSAKFDRDGFRAVVGAPLESGSEVVGVLGLAYLEEDRTFGDDEFALLSRFAELASIALDNARLYSSAQQELAERERAEEVLRGSEEQHRMLVETVQEGIGFVDAEERITYCNRAYAEIFGLTPEDLTGRSLLEFLDDEQRQKALEQTALRKNGVRSSYEITVTTGGGNKKHLSASGTPIMDQTGSLRGAVHAIIDVTESKRAEKALQASEERFRHLVEQAADALFVHDLEGRFVSVNRQACESLGYTQEELLNLSVADIEENFSSAEIPKVWEKVVTGVPFTLDGVHRRKDGTRFPVEVRVGLFETGKNRLMLAAARDVTERKEAEEALTKSEARFRSLIQNSSDIITVYDAKGTVRYDSPAIERMLGYEPEERLGASSFELIHPDDIARAKGEFVDALRKPNLPVSIEVRVRHKDGSWRHVEATGTNLLSDPSVRGIVLNSRDITERKETEEALKKSESHNRAVLETAPDAILAMTTDGIVRSFNRGAERIFGYAAEEAVGRPLKMLMPERFREPHEKGFRRYLKTGEAHVIGKGPIELAGLRKSGEEFPLELSLGEMRGEEGERVFVGVIRDVTERRRAETALAESEKRYRHLVELSPETVVVHSEGRVVYANEAAARLVSAASTADLVGRPIMSFAHPDYRERMAERIREAFATGKSIPLEEEKIVRLDGGVADVEVTGVPTVYEGKPAIQLLARDIAERKRAEEALRRSEERFRGLVQNASDVVTVIGTDGTVQYVSPAVERVLGYKPEDRIGSSVFEPASVHPDDVARVRSAFAELFAKGIGSSITDEIRIRHADGSWRYIEAVGKNLIGDPSIGGIVVNYHDVTERKAFEEQLKHRAFHDELTGLPNRALFVDRLDHALAGLERSEGKAVAVLFLDLDDFKVINDSLGHAAGDALLVAVAGRLRSRMRPEDTLARFGGDEFAILLEDVDEAGDAAQVAERILEELRTPFDLGGREMFVSPSVGISLGTAASDRAEDLLRNADIALYQAKARGKARYAVFDSHMYATVLKRLRTESDLRRALERGEFRVFYQPKMKLDTDLQGFLRFSGSRAIVAGAKETTRAPRIVGTEALVRWEHPDLGLISPTEFVPVAEETGLIVPIGRWVLREACLQTRQWNERYPDDPPLTVCVNLSARQFHDPGLCQDVARILQETGLDPQYLSLEITESAVMKDVEVTSATLRELKGLGVELSVDDFGTGYSSLSYLKRFPVDYLKIDRSFVEELKGNAEDAMLVSGIIRLAHTLGMRVVAEGVESVEQLQRLQGLGCDLAQGYYFSKPLPGEAVPGLLAHARQG